ncbi:hypothetical protein JHK82_044297 [Glycine max]|nr:hypothetical protein JHK82_044297 [Glycine max]
MRRDQPPRESRYAHYTPLTASRPHIMNQALAVDILTIPKRANTPPKADYSKRCRYHRNHGHSTKECSVLKDKIEDLIKLGHLKKPYIIFILNPDTFSMKVLFRGQYENPRNFH